MYRLTIHKARQGKHSSDFNRNYKAIIFFLLSVVVLNVNAQQELNFRIVEDSSYALYLKHDWKQLQKLGHRAIRQNIDYFYLRERLGIAFYEQKKYQLALPQFVAANNLNSGDELVQEYIYYAYAFDNRYDEALRYSKQFNKALQVKTKSARPAPVNMVMADFTAKLPSNTSVAFPFYFLSVGLNHRITKGYSAYHAYSYSWQKYTQGNYGQHRYYLAVNIPLKKGFALTPAFSMLYDHYSDSIIRYPEPPNPPGPPRIEIQKRGYFSFIGSVNVSGSFPYVRVDLTNAFSNLDTAYQIQHTLGITVYPLANQKLAIGGALIVHTNNFYKNIAPLVQATLRFNAPQFFAFNVVYTYAGVYNYHLYNGYLVQNGYDLLRSNLTVAPEFIIKRRYSIYAAYQFETKTSRTTGVNYFAHGITLGTKLKF